MKQDNRKAVVIFCLFGIIPVIWLGLLMAPAMGEGLPAILIRFHDAMNHPFDIEICEDSLKTVLLVL